MALSIRFTGVVGDPADDDGIDYTRNFDVSTSDPAGLRSLTELFPESSVGLGEYNLLEPRPEGTDAFCDLLVAGLVDLDDWSNEGIHASWVEPLNAARQWLLAHSTLDESDAPRVDYTLSGNPTWTAPTQWRTQYTRV